MALSSATAGEKLVSACESWTTAVFKKVTCWRLSPHCTCSLGLHVSTKGSLTTVKTLACCHFLQFSWQDISFAEEKRLRARGDIGKRATMDSCHPNVPWWSVQVWLPRSVYLSQCQHSLVSGLTGPRRHEIIHLSFHLRTRKPFFTRPETSINYSDGRKSEERQIHLDIIGKQVCSRLLSRFPLR